MDRIENTRPVLVDTEARSRLEAWLTGQVSAASSLMLSPLTKSSIGFSNDTMVCHITCRQEGREVREDVVVRLEPTDFRVFPEYALARPRRIMQLSLT